MNVNQLLATIKNHFDYMSEEELDQWYREMDIRMEKSIKKWKKEPITQEFLNREITL